MSRTALAIIIVLTLVAVAAVAAGVVEYKKGEGFRARRWGRSRAGRRPPFGVMYGNHYGWPSYRIPRGWWWPLQHDAGWWGGHYAYPHYTEYVPDYTDLRPCPRGDPTGGRALCKGSENNWEVVDRCRTEGVSGDAEISWRKEADGTGECYSFRP